MKNFLKQLLIIITYMVAAIINIINWVITGQITIINLKESKCLMKTNK